MVEKLTRECVQNAWDNYCSRNRSVVESVVSRMSNLPYGVRSIIGVGEGFFIKTDLRGDMWEHSFGMCREMVDFEGWKTGGDSEWYEDLMDTAFSVERSPFLMVFYDDKVERYVDSTYPPLRELELGTERQTEHTRFITCKHTEIKED